MISILIPIYNFDCSPLINRLSKICSQVNVKTEIIAFEDGSTNIFKDNISALENCGGRYLSSKSNIGRSKARNILAEAASNRYLIFLDCDSDIITGENFINNYINIINAAQKEGYENDFLICGGTLYKNFRNVENKFVLHCKAGYCNEQNTYTLEDSHFGLLKPVECIEKKYKNINEDTFKEKNSINKYSKRHLLSNNFLISKATFNKIKFDERLEKYGHEDTLFGLELRKKGVYIFYINNPVVHLGLKDYDKYISDVKASIENLKFISDNIIDKDDRKDFKLLKVYDLISSLKLKHLITIIYNRLGDSIINNLKTRNPNLYLLNLYKLGYLCSLNSNSK
ncbi:MAG: glycosyltransferase [Bacteroidales bacterium]|nr:glycosyltransferase [Bacteroidales bacterium]